jgi:hypothetical protein
MPRVTPLAERIAATLRRPLALSFTGFIMGLVAKSVQQAAADRPA